LERPDVDKIDGSPVIAIEQKTTSKSPRSTVGTITEIYDFLLLYARAGDAYSYNTGEKMVSYSDEQIQQLIIENYRQAHQHFGTGNPREERTLRRVVPANCQTRFRKSEDDEEIKDITPGMKLDSYKDPRY
jgi:excinuclease ABC subunit A